MCKRACSNFAGASADGWMFPPTTCVTVLLLLLSWLRLAVLYIYTFFLIKKKKKDEEELHATFGIFLSPDLWVWVLEKYFNFCFYSLQYLEAPDCNGERWEDYGCERQRVLVKCLIIVFLFHCKCKWLLIFLKGTKIIALCCCVCVYRRCWQFFSYVTAAFILK